MRRKIVIVLLAMVLGFQMMTTPEIKGFIKDNSTMMKKAFAAQTAVVKETVGDYRISLLSESLVRIEKTVKGEPFDIASYYIVGRDEFDGVGQSSRTSAGGKTTVSTNSYSVELSDNAKNLSGAVIKNSAGNVIWSYSGLPANRIELPSPANTGSAYAIADTPRMTVPAHGYSYNEAAIDLYNGWKIDEGAEDIYVFVPLGDAKQLRKDFVALTGRSELIPLTALGSWDSRYYEYTQESAKQQILDYERYDLPLDYMVIDTDWRVNTGAGGMGYDINTDLFPDFKEFFDWAESKGISILFNDHPEPRTGAYSLLDPIEVQYRESKLKGLLEMGLDAWWYDRNWHTALISPSDKIAKESFGMYLFNYITQDYYNSIAAEGSYAQRAMIMGNVEEIWHGNYANVGDLASHRFTFQWTGDINQTEGDLRQEVKNLVETGMLAAIPYVSADIGGHNGNPSNELYARWTQFGTFSPIYRPHCTKDVHGIERYRMPWLYGEDVLNMSREYINMRYRMLPLYYTLGFENYMTGMPLMRSLEFDYPQYKASSRTDQYLIGNDVLVAPLSTENGTRSVFIPDGEWVDVWTGKRFVGPQEYTVTHGSYTSPIFVKAGSITPLAQNMKNTSEKDWSKLALDVYPSTTSAASGTLFEDDTITLAYKDGKYRTTDFRFAYTGANTFNLDIDAVKGSFTGERAFSNREWKVRVHLPDGYGAVSSVKSGATAVAFNTIAQSSDGTPFAYSGASRDGKILEFTVSGDIATAISVEIKFDSCNAATIEEEISPFRLTSVVPVGGLNLTTDLIKDYAYYGANDNKDKVVRKSGVTDSVIGELKSIGDKHVFNDNYPVSWSDGVDPVSGSQTYGIYSIDGFNQSINVKAGSGRIAFRVGGWRSNAIFTVKSGGVFREELFGNLKASYMREVIIEYTVTEDTKFEVSLLKTFGDRGGHNVSFTAVYIPDAKTQAAVATKRISGEVRLYEDNILDWMRITGGSKSGNTVNAITSKKTGVANSLIANLAYSGDKINNVGGFGDYKASFVTASGGAGSSSGLWFDGGQSSAKVDVNITDEVGAVRFYTNAWDGARNASMRMKVTADTETLYDSILSSSKDAQFDGDGGSSPTETTFYVTEDLHGKTLTFEFILVGGSNGSLLGVAVADASVTAPAALLEPPYSPGGINNIVPPDSNAGNAGTSENNIGADIKLSGGQDVKPANKTLYYILAASLVILLTGAVIWIVSRKAKDKAKNS